MKAKIKSFKVKNAGVLDEANIELGDITLIFGRNNTGKTALVYNLYLAFIRVWFPLAPEMEGLLESLNRMGLADIMSLPDDRQQVAFDELFDRTDTPVAEIIKSMSHIMQKPNQSKLDEEAEHAKEYLRKLKPEEITSELTNRVKYKSGLCLTESLFGREVHQSIGEEHEITFDLSSDEIEEFLSGDRVDEIINISTTTLMDSALSYSVHPLDYLLFALMTSVRLFSNNRSAFTVFKRRLDVPDKLK